MSGKTRRNFLRGLGSSLSLPLWAQLAACTRTSESPSTKNGGSPLALTDTQERKFLFVFGAMGGASINDSFMAVRQSETKNERTLNTFPDSLVVQAEGTDLRAVDYESDSIAFLPFKVKANQSRFLAKYAHDIMVATVEASTVAHATGQYRCVSGNNAWNGRTLQEAVAAQYGRDLLMPNVNMATVGFAEHGQDPNLPAYARAQGVADPAFFPFGLHGFAGIPGAPSAKLMNLARNFRENDLEARSAFMKSSGNTKLVRDWLAFRARQAEMEERDLINKLNPFEDTEDFPFGDFGLAPNADGKTLRDLFPRLGVDRLQTQALMAYLLVAKGLSCAVTFGIGMDPGVDGRDDPDDPIPLNVPSGFDFSHNGHRSTQALLWSQTLDTIDRLITLLKATEYRNGESLWRHSLIYIATEFGRDKDRESGAAEFTTGHHQNNGSVIISPLANGGRVLGGIDRDTLMTYGFDPLTGEPAPNTTMKDAHIYSGILQSMGVDTAGANLPAVPAMARKR
jgi:hypothetical protein